MALKWVCKWKWNAYLLYLNCQRVFRRSFLFFPPAKLRLSCELWGILLGKRLWGDGIATGHAAERKWQDERFSNGACISSLPFSVCYIFFILPTMDDAPFATKSIARQFRVYFSHDGSSSICGSDKDAPKGNCERGRWKLRQMKRKARTGVSHFYS